MNKLDKGLLQLPGGCNTQDSSACCVEGHLYDVYYCSPKVSSRTKANLTLRSFDRGGDGDLPSECDNQYHNDYELVVALSTVWFRKGKRCNHFINIYGNGKWVRAKVIDQCDSRVGCDAANLYEPPSGNNIVRTTEAVWDALGVPRSQWGARDIHWSDA
ncbi:Uncharacterized protein TCM_005359 [Theobroma cacao]|uniref:Ripening-related protein 1 n=1 Tax=Theobroma cacao TaxID=3641 RepID=A0A061DTD7_THECC|nr:Uncharacterized protein TCM_005359 [Theobroma cacao]